MPASSAIVAGPLGTTVCQVIEVAARGDREPGQGAVNLNAGRSSSDYQARLLGPGRSDHLRSSASQTRRTEFGSSSWRAPTSSSSAVRPSRWIVTVPCPSPRCSGCVSKRHPRSVSHNLNVPYSIGPLR
jgi:hypothetical protein